MRFRLIWDNQYQIVLKKHDVAALYYGLHSAAGGRNQRNHEDLEDLKDIPFELAD